MIKSKSNHQAKPSDKVVHFKPYPLTSDNVRCLNGSAHALYSTDIKEVTCKKCLDPKECQCFWIHHVKANKIHF